MNKQRSVLHANHSTMLSARQFLLPLSCALAFVVGSFGLLMLNTASDAKAKAERQARQLQSTARLKAGAPESSDHSQPHQTRSAKNASATPYRPVDLVASIFGRSLGKRDSGDQTASAAGGRRMRAPGGTSESDPGFTSAQTNTSVSGGPDLVHIEGPVTQDLDLRDLPYIPPSEEHEERRLTRHPPAGVKMKQASNDVATASFGASFIPTMPNPLQTFPGMTSNLGCNGCLPPDTEGDVGPGHYIQSVNSSIRVQDKSGNTLAGPITYNSFFSAMGTSTPCGSNVNGGDGVVFYDHISDRWVVSDFAFPAFPGTSFYQCVGVSKTGDPIAGGWYLYAVQVDPANTNFLGDYPKFGLWPDAYYLSMNLFSNNTTFNGVRTYALDRNSMINGGPANAIGFSIAPADLGDQYSLLPATFRHGSAPPLGQPEWFMDVNSSATAGTVETQVFVRRFHADFATPANSTFGVGATHTPDGIITVNGFVDAFNSTAGTLIVPNGTATTTQYLDTLGDKLMFPLVYQNLGGAESVYASQTVNNNQGGTGPTAVRWYQFNMTGNSIPATPTQQQSFNNGADGLWRWMPSINVDSQGNVAIGYSTSNTNLDPGIRYAGRLAGDPLNDLAQGEAIMTPGTGHQTSTSGRWGDYSAMFVDPLDTCTFYHTNEYYSATSSAAWNTRTGSFRFPGCVSPPLGTLQGTITNSSTSATITGAVIAISNGASVLSNTSGIYSRVLSPSTYNVTFSKTGFAPQIINGVTIANNSTTTLNVALVPNGPPPPPVSAGPVTVTATAGTLGPTDYATLKAAFDAINAGTHQGVISAAILGNTTEIASAVLNASGSGAASYTSIIIQPGGGAARTISGTLAAPLVDLNGADNVTIDGLNAGGNSLTLTNANTGTTTGTSTIRFINGATNNIVRNCSIQGSSTVAVGTAGAAVLFSTTTGTGNNNNTISGNNIGPAGANLPVKAISAVGTTTNNNTINRDNVIDNNNIFDFFGAGGVSTTGLDIRTGNTNWTISNNRIYQTATRTFTTLALRYAGITLVGTTGVNGNWHTITGNIIGFGAANGTGTTTITGSTNEVRGLDLAAASSGTATSVQGNTISGINQTSSRNLTAAANSPFIGIALGTTSGVFDVGNVTGNTIGSLDGSSTIVLNETSTTASNAPIIGIYDFSLSSGNISNNKIGAITIQSTGTTVGFRGILVNTSSAATETITNNIIGGAAAAGAITDTQVGSYVMYGIQTALPAVTMTGNTIRNLVGNSNFPATVVGSGIVVNVSTAASNTSLISQNTIHSLSNASGAAQTSMYAMDLTLPATTNITANLIERNFIHSITNTSTDNTSQMWGIVQRGSGTAGVAVTGTVQNNMIRLGIDKDGNSITGGLSIIGIRDIQGATGGAGTTAVSYYFNSVYIGGSGVASSSATYAFNSSAVTSTRNYKDNIFWNARSNASGAGKNYAIAVGGTAPNPAGLTSNYNDLYATGTGSFVGQFNAVDQTALSDWQTATGQDANSISADPLFVNPTGTSSTIDLHITCASPARLAGTPVTTTLANPFLGVTNDFDGNARPATMPDIGADQTGSCSVAPTITCPSPITQSTDPNQCTAVVTFTPTATGTPTPTVTCTPASGSAFPKGVTTVSCTASNGTPPDATCSFTVTVNDTAPPVLSGCTNVTADTSANSCDAVVNYTQPTASDNCGGSPVVTCTPASGSTFQKGVTTVNCSATDMSNNTGTCSFTVTVNDMQPPTVTCPAPITHSTDPNVCTAVVTFADPVVTDNCPPCNVAPPKPGQSPHPPAGCAVVCVPASGSTFNKGVTTVNCSASDLSSNTGMCSFTVTVNDNQAPVLSGCTNQTINAVGGACTATATYTPTATDNCDGVRPVTCIPASGSTFNKGVTTVTCSASDLNAPPNTGMCTFTITVNDTQAPQSCIMPPANMIGWWPGDGNANDIQGTNNGTLAGGATATGVGKVGQAFSLNGTSAYVQVPNKPEWNFGSNAFTIDLWVNFNQVNPFDVLVAHDDGSGLHNKWLFWIDAGNLEFHTNTTTAQQVFIDTPFSPVANTWYHLAVTRNGSTYTLYINGVGTNVTNATPVPDASASLTIGSNDVQDHYFVNGLIDEVEIFNRALTQSEVQGIYNAGSFGKCKPVTVSTDPNVCTAVVNYTKPVSVDNCDGARTVTCVPDTGTTFAKGVTTVTCTSSDTSNNTTTTTFTVTVKDTQAPTLTCPNNISVIGNACSMQSYTTPTPSDNCAGPTASCSPASGTCFAVGTTTVTCTATDTSSNTNSCTFTVTVTPCTITCPNNVSVDAAPGVCTAVATFADPTTTGQCGTVTCSPVSGSTFQKGVTTVTCSTTAGPSCTFTVTVNDSQPPVITCPGPVTHATDPNVCTAVVTFADPTVTDNCPPCNGGGGKPGGNVNVGCQVVCSPASGSTFQKGVTTVMCTATDASSNTAMCSFTVTVNDTQAPAITCPAAVIQSTDPNVCSALVTYSNATATDNCPGVGTPVCSPASGTTFQKGVTTVTCSVSDASNNSSNCSFTVTINDTQPPTVTCPGPITKSTDPNVCTAVVTFADPVVTDNCPPCNGGSTKPGGKTPQGTPSCSVVCVPASGSTFQKGVTTVSCTATDVSGNTAPCSFTVTVNDTQAPAITCPAPITKSTDPNACTAVVSFTPTATDNCPLGPTPIVCTPASGTTFQKGVTTVSCTATDTSTNTSNCSFTVTVNDTQVPAITCPANITQPATAGQCSAIVTYSNATATDNCPGVGTPSCVPASGATFQKGVTTVTCSVTDASSNPASCTFTVTITDTQPPVITCPANVTKGTDPNVCNAVVTYPNSTATDNCGVVTPSCVPASGTTFQKGVTTVSCNVSDASKNSASCTFTVTVNDTQNPSVTCPSNMTFTTPGNSDPCGVVTYATPGATDNCPMGPSPVSCTPASGTCFPVGMTTVTCTATDTSNNHGSCTFKITVQNPCTITCPANITKGNDPNQCGAVVTFAPTTTGGGCGTVACSPASGSFFPKGTTTVTCTTAAGPSCSFTVTVNDTQAPTITCPANVTHGTDPNVCQAVVTYPAPTVSDNCPGVGSPTCVPASGSTFQKGVTTVTCTVKDSSNNMNMCSFTVTVNDTQPPVLVGCPAGITKAAQASCPFTTTAIVTYVPPVATDNCPPPPTVVCVPPSGSVFPAGTTSVTCTATDSSGNTATCTFPVNIYSFCLQDDSTDQNVVFVNAATGDYLFCKNGLPIASGQGTLVVHGCNFQIDHTKGDRKVHVQGDTSVNGAGAGTAYIQKAGGGFVVQITDRRMSDDGCVCAPMPPPAAPSK